MTEAAADVDEDYLVGHSGPTADFFLHRENRKPVWQSVALDHHILLEVAEALRLVWEPDETGHINVEGLLQRCLAVVGDVLVLGLG